jgi:general stress protein CsbA
MRRKKKHIITKDVVGLLLGEVVSTKTIAHCRRGCGWLASRRGSKYEKKTHIVAKDVVGLQIGYDDSLTKIKTY